MKSSRPVWMAIFTIAAAVVALATFLLMTHGGSTPTDAVLASAGAFAGTMLILLTSAHFLAGSSS